MNLSKLSYNFVYQNRLRKYNLFINHLKPDSDTKILDVGASDVEALDYANLLEKIYPHPENITALGIETYDKEFSRRYPRVKTVTYNGGTFPFDDKEFEICHSSAVIEHVGGADKQKDFLNEICRVSKSSFITTPNRYFPLEVHTRVLFLHYLPKKIFDSFLTKKGKPWATGDYMNPLSLRDIRRLLAECGITSYEILKNKKLGFTIDFIIII